VAIVRTKRGAATAAVPPAFAQPARAAVLKSDAPELPPEASEIAATRTATGVERGFTGESKVARL
jgi:hypothetical protein